MEYAIERLCKTEVIIALVEPYEMWGDVADALIRELQFRFKMGAMLVSRPGPGWSGATAVAHFNCDEHFQAMKRLDDIDWNNLHDKPEAELPF